MAETINAGSILIRVDASLPETLRVEGKPFAYCWRLVINLDGYGLDRKIREMGWSLIRIAGEVKALALGFDEQKTACKALKRGLARLQFCRFNCLEISQVRMKRFVGLSHAMVSICPRNIQKGLHQEKAELLKD